MPVTILPFTTFENVGSSFEVACGQYGDVPLAPIIINFAPGQVVKPHRHPYAEIFVVIKGEAVYQIDGEDVPVQAGQLVILPPNTVHAFVNTGLEPLWQVDVHASGEFITEWLDD